ncbi:hypothetical protein Kfla_5319 [Kribbella flavida DSM 17836]|uniref:Secreted protein n=1 Tax=Kribbella flavida (strain DSM 17836 / JCM 10339 / NBRC 14399) TaxID=479435 RepID=D2PL77_KRIFD|nr:hypothetical protein [Kribbella flavida]ADB34332.1 hypothetical protein Kfla_5319 [Kribbella flavida DSM 17836]
MRLKSVTVRAGFATAVVAATLGIIAPAAHAQPSAAATETSGVSAQGFEYRGIYHYIECQNRKAATIAIGGYAECRWRVPLLPDYRELWST